MKIILSRADKPSGSIHCGVSDCQCHDNDWRAEIVGSPDGIRSETSGSPGEALQWLIRDHADALGLDREAAEGMQVVAWEIKNLYADPGDASGELVEILSRDLQVRGIVVVQT